MKTIFNLSHHGLTKCKMSEAIPEERCECGRLLFRKTPRGFELKCSRCKRICFLDPAQLFWAAADTCCAQDPTSERESCGSVPEVAAKQVVFESASAA